MLVRLFLLLILLTCPLYSAQAEVYKWVDANGTVTFRDTPPPAGVQAAKVEAAPLNVVDTPESSKVELIETTPRPRRIRADVELYTTRWCGYCRKARAYLDEHGVSYREYDIEKDQEAARRKFQISGGYRGIPFAVINGRKIYGFDQAGYAEALGIR